MTTSPLPSEGKEAPLSLSLGSNRILTRTRPRIHTNIHACACLSLSDSLLLARSLRWRKFRSHLVESPCKRRARAHARHCKARRASPPTRPPFSRSFPYYFKAALPSLRVSDGATRRSGSLGVAEERRWSTLPFRPCTRT